jgi:hypothetical protein
MKSKRSYLIIGLAVLCISLFIVMDAVMTDSKIPVAVILSFTFAFMNLSLSYLSSDFQKKDERMRLIKEKGMYYSYFAIMSYFLIFILLVGFGGISISVMTVLILLASLTVLTVSLSMVILSKIY